MWEGRWEFLQGDGEDQAVRGFEGKGFGIMGLWVCGGEIEDRCC